MQQAAAQGHPSASVASALAAVYSALSDAGRREAFAAMMQQAMREVPGAMYCVGEMMCCGCWVQRR